MRTAAARVISDLVPRDLLAMRKAGGQCGRKPAFPHLTLRLGDGIVDAAEGGGLPLAIEQQPGRAGIAVSGLADGAGIEEPAALQLDLGSGRRETAEHLPAVERDRKGDVAVTDEHERRVGELQRRARAWKRSTPSASPVGRSPWRKARDSCVSTSDVQRAAAAASSLKSLTVSSPRTTRSWFPTRQRSARPFTALQHSLGRGPYPTVSPRHQTASTSSASISASTASRA